MNQEQIRRLVCWMLADHTPKSSQQCADFLHISAARFRKEIPHIRQVLRTAGAEIVSKSGKGNGYMLKVSDQIALENFTKNAEQRFLNFQYKSHRVVYIAKILLESEDYIKASRFEEALHISQTQFNHDMKEVRSLADRYHLAVVHKPYYGLKIEGSEFDIRGCMCQVVNMMNDMMETRKNGENSELMDLLKEALIYCCKKQNYELSSITMNNLIVHLFVSIKRASNQQTVELTDELRDELKRDKQYTLAAMIIEKVQDEIDIRIPDDEVYYITMHLSSKRILKEDIGNLNNTAIQLVQEMVNRILERYCIDLRPNLNFQMMLAMHVTPLIDRVMYQVKLSNPLLREIKTNYLVPYELALCCAGIIDERYNTQLSEDEIGYIALHIKLALDQQKLVPEKRILLVNSMGRGNARLLKYDFEKRYPSCKERMTTCDVIQVSSLDLSIYDAIFTTVPLREEDVSVKIPVFLIDAIGKSGEDVNIEKFMTSEGSEYDIHDFFPADMFFGVVDASDKTELIALLCEKIGKVYPLPDGFVDSVLQREKMAETSFGGEVAFPHPAQIMTEDSFVSVAILQRPMDWGREKIQVVLLSSFSRGFLKTHGKVFEFITELISNRKYAQLLVDDPSRKTFDRIFDMILQKGRV